ncbi:hypothetical protein NATSA_01300 [Natronogracilivirgula saccharolytica]|uniref:Uncharacterized protein n=2 Tax=Natronogracilivirga saccharolytica TaxID=2812953 RepID=A0A8J7RG61_9BACT|nr:hypothetical protein [Natronogracilivirga saccharolytica]
MITIIVSMSTLFPTVVYSASYFDKSDTVETWEGSLRLFGNEPFTMIALVTDEEERWFLEMEEEELQYLWHNRQGRIRITGIPIVKNIAGRSENVIVVKKHEWIKNRPDADSPH